MRFLVEAWSFESKNLGKKYLLDQNIPENYLDQR